jgi:hypothetical protein
MPLFDLLTVKPYIVEQYILRMLDKYRVSPVGPGNVCLIDDPPAPEGDIFALKHKCRRISPPSPKPHRLFFGLSSVKLIFRPSTLGTILKEEGRTNTKVRQEYRVFKNFIVEMGLKNMIHKL